MIEFNRVFIDTAPFIYYLEKNPEYFDKAHDFFLYCYENQKSIITSVITVEEYLVFPYTINNNELIVNFNKFLLTLGIHVVDIDRQLFQFKEINCRILE